ncbi:MAG: VPLPA-CTERM sorting domain-containing protein [Spongiibacteraceae bacterium]
MKFQSIAAGLVSIITACSAASAASFVPYSNVGFENPIEYTFMATTSGEITAYFAGNGGAGYTETLSLLVNGVSTGVVALNNQSSSYGDSVSLGSVNAGDVLVFALNVVDTATTWYSNKSSNVDGVNHVYSTLFDGNSLIPAGVYVGFEDLSAISDPNFGKADFNYKDTQFVFTNTSVACVPVPTAAFLFGSGLMGMVGVARRRVA